MKITEVGNDHSYARRRGWIGPDAAAPTSLVGGVSDGDTSTPTPKALEFAGLTVTDLGGGTTLASTSWKIPVRCATTSAGTMASSFEAGDTVDGIVLVQGDRILIKDQAAPAQNGIYLVRSSGAPARAFDLSLDFLVPGAVVDVLAGTTNAASLWMCTNQTEPTLDTDAITFALINGAGVGNFELSIEGGQSVIKAHGPMGATETFDPTDGNVHTGTLNASCTFTLSAPSGSGACLLEIRALQDGTGGWAITWPGSVAWKGGIAPTPTTVAGTLWVYTVETTDGGTTWIGDWGIAAGIPSSSFATPAIALGTAAAAGVATTTIRSDSTIVAFDATVPAAIGTAATGAVAKAARRDHVHPTGAGTPSTQALGDAASTGTGPAAAMTDHKHAMPALSSATPLVASGSGTVGTALPSSREDHVHPAAASSSSSGGHTHVAGETHLSDGSTTTYTLDDYYEPESVIAWNTTTLARLTVTEVLPDKATVSAAGASGDKIVFDYAATLA